MADYEQLSPTEWRWPVGNRYQGVRLFRRTGRLIWSRWAETSEGPQFDAGIAQEVDAFLADGPPAAIAAPDDLLAVLRSTLADDQPRRGLFGRRRRD
jgi:hypothetical protein